MSDFVDSRRIQQAAYAAEHPHWIDTVAELEAAAKHWQQKTHLAIDTEFIRERTYYAALGLIQVADQDQVWLVDMPAIDDTNALTGVLTDPEIVKIVHSGSEDLGVLYQTLGCPIVNLFDSQVGAALLGHPLQIGYSRMIEQLFGIKLPKGETRSNWLARPLSNEQIHYAANDVSYLIIAAEWLEQQLRQQQRWEWLQQDMLAMLQKAYRPIETDILYQRVKGAARLQGQALLQLQKLAAWRDETARSENKPRSFIIQDDTLISLAELPIQDINELSLRRIDSLNSRKRGRYGQQLISLLEQPADRIPPVVPGRLDDHEEQLVKALKRCVNTTAEQLGIDPALLCSRRILEYKVRNTSTDQAWFDHWRGELLNTAVTATIQSMNQASTNTI